MMAPNKSTLHSNCSTKRLFECIRGDEDIVTLQGLLEEGAGIDARESEGYTPLLLACLQKREKIADLLIKSGANVVVKCNRDEYTVLHYASVNGWINIVQTLVTKVPDLNARDIRGGTSLHAASMIGHSEIVKCLLEKGADINARNSNGNAALHIASSRGHLEIVEYLVEKGAGINSRGYKGCAALLFASFQGHLEIVECFVKKGADINSRGYKGYTALHIASLQGHQEIAKCLVEKADINIVCIGGKTALHIASYLGHIEVVKCLVGKGCRKGLNLDARDISGHTALVLACINKQLGIAQYLLEAGASWDIVDKEGYSPFNIVTLKEKPEFEFIKLFIENGAYLKRVDYEAMVKGTSLQVLQDVKLCCQAIVNKYNNHNVPELYKLPVSKFLPQIEKIKITSNSEVARAIELSVGFQIQTKGHCNILDARHMGLSVLSVRSVLEYYEKKASELKNGLKR